MAVEYSFGPRLIHLSFHGETSVSTLERVLDEALDDPACPPLPEIVVDIRHSTSVGERSSDELRSGARLFAARQDRLGRRSAVIAEPGFQFGLMRMTGSYAEGSGRQVGVFSSEGEALAWLLGGEDEG